MIVFLACKIKDELRAFLYSRMGNHKLYTKRRLLETRSIFILPLGLVDILRSYL